MRSAFILSLLLTACTSSALADRIARLPQDQRCRTSGGDREWLAEALAGWRTVRRDYLRVSDERLPQIVVYDNRCSYTLAAPPAQPRRWAIAEHRGEVTLPNGGRIPPAPNAFNAATDAGDNFVVVSLPSIWRPVAPRSEIPLEWFLEGVLFHELSHAYQSVATPAVSFPALLRRLPQSANVTDDSVQEAFEANADYVREYESERDLLFRAASAPTDVEARALACDGLARFRARRARHFTGTHWALVDELSLTTEGLGEWVSYKWLTRGRGLPSSLVLSKLRGRHWSQEQGLAIFLTVDRLVPDWQERLFSSSPATAEQLLTLACGR